MLIIVYTDDPFNPNGVGMMKPYSYNQGEGLCDNQTYSYFPGDRNSIYYDPKKFLHHNGSLLSDQTIATTKCCDHYQSFQPRLSNCSNQSHSLGYASSVTVNNNTHRNSIIRPANSEIGEIDMEDHLTSGTTYAEPDRTRK